MNNLTVGSKIALLLTENGIQMIVNGNGDEVLPWQPNIGQSYYAVFDLYGQCQQVNTSFSCNLGEIILNTFLF